MKGIGVLVERKRGKPRLWRASPGQAIAEMALVLPVFTFILAATFTGSQFLSAVVGLDGAARAGVLAYVAEQDETTDTDNDGDTAPMPPAPSQWLADAVTAVNNEQGSCSGSGCFVSVVNQAACTAGRNCVWVVEVQGTRNNHKIEVIHVQKAVISYIGIFGDKSVSAQAGLEP
jgi:Flp pilus assembly protein TadG